MEAGVESGSGTGRCENAIAGTAFDKQDRWVKLHRGETLAEQAERIINETLAILGFRRAEEKDDQGVDQTILDLNYKIRDSAEDEATLEIHYPDKKN